MYKLENWKERVQYSEPEPMEGLRADFLVLNEIMVSKIQSQKLLWEKNVTIFIFLVLILGGPPFSNFLQILIPDGV